MPIYIYIYIYSERRQTKGAPVAFTSLAGAWVRSSHVAGLAQMFLGGALNAPNFQCAQCDSLS